MTALIALLAAGPQTFSLRYHPRGAPVAWKVIENRLEGKTRNTLETHLRLTGSTLTVGPFSSGGRTFGRPKDRMISITPQATLAGDGFGRPPFLLSVPLPSQPVKMGDTWTGVIVGPTPMPAGTKVVFRVVGPAKVAGSPCVRVRGKIDADLSGAKITGGGEWSVRLDDGLVQSGSLNALLVYRRPDPVTRKITESARVNVEATISRG